MIRELLINIENIRDCENCSNNLASSASTNPDIFKENGLDIPQEMMQAAKMSQRKLYHLGQQHGKHVLDINQEASKAIKSRPIHQGNQRGAPIKI